MQNRGIPWPYNELVIDYPPLSQDAFKSKVTLSAPNSRLERIIASSTEVFARKGYDAASMEDIASAADLLKGSLYHYLRSKEDLLYYLVARINEEAIDIVNTTERSTTDPWQQLNSFAREYAHYNAAHAEEVSIYYRNWRQLSPARYQEARKQRRAVTDHLVALIVTNQNSGKVLASVDPELAAMYYFGSSNWLHTWYSPRFRLSANAVGDACAEAWVRSIAA